MRRPTALRRQAPAALPAALAAAILGAPPLGASAAEIEAVSTVAEALIYPQGATVGRTAAFSAEAGRHEVVIGDLPVDMDVDSLRVAGLSAGDAAGFEILGVSHKIRQPRVAPKSDPERQRLLDRIETLEWELRDADDAAVEAENRIEYMRAFRDATVSRPPFFARPGRAPAKAGPEVDGADRALPYGGAGRPGLFGVAETWEDAWGLIAKESAAARKALRAAERARARIEEEIAKTRDALDQIGPGAPARGELTISIVAAAAIDDGALKIEYLTPNARWAPLYDLKLASEGVEEPGLFGQLSLIRRASVSQETGEDWGDVRLSLSTARPTGRIAARAPRPPRAYLQPLAPPEPKRRGLAEADEAPSGGLLRGRLQAQEFDAPAMEPAPAPMAAQSAAPPPPILATEASALADYSGAGVVYQIKEPARIPGDGEPRQVLIGSEESEVPLVVRSAPADDAAAYLYALLENTDAPLPAGRAAVYRDGVFFGQFQLSYVAPGDETALPLGRLDEIKIQHLVKTRTTGEEGLFTTSNREQSRFEMTARNLGALPRKITLFAARPYTETEEIKITLTGDKPTEADIEGRRGALAWTFDLKPGAEKRIPFGYDISWPEGRTLRMGR